MKNIFWALLALGIFSGPAAAYEYEDPGDIAVSSDAAQGNSYEDEQPVIQESDEDLAAFVTDYLDKDIALKGAFLLEDKATGKVLRLRLVSVDGKIAPGAAGGWMVTAYFKDAADKRFTVLFRVRDGSWGGLDIFKIELKDPAGDAGQKK